MNQLFLRSLCLCLVANWYFSGTLPAAEPEISAPKRSGIAESAKTGANNLDTSLLEAAQKGDLKMVANLLGQGAAVDSKDSKGWTPLIFAAKGGNAAIARLLIGKGANVNLRTATETGSTVLSFAAEGANLALIQDLLDHGADINGTSKNGSTPLFWTAWNGKKEVLLFLISKGANPNLMSFVDDQGSTWSPLMNAANNGKIEMVRLLLEKGAEMEKPNNKGDTALMELAKRPYPEVLKFLIAKGANVNARKRHGHTALIYAAFNGQVENLKLLLAAGADPFATATDSEEPDDPHGRYDALKLAAGHPEALEVVRKAQNRTGRPAQPPPD